MVVIVAPAEVDHQPKPVTDVTVKTIIVVIVLTTHATRHLNHIIGSVSSPSISPNDPFRVDSLSMIEANKQLAVYGLTLTMYLRERVFASTAWT